MFHLLKLTIMIKDFSNVNYFCPDHVVCNNCMTEMYVDYDAHVCPICGKAGCLMDVEQEVEH